MNKSEALQQISDIINSLETGEAQEVDKYGFHPIQEDGTREVRRLNEVLDSWAEGDKFQKKLSKEFPRKVLINLNLPPELNGLFLTNKQKYHFIHDYQIKSYDKSFPPAAKTVFEAVDLNGKPIKDTLSATSGNASFSSSKHYEQYLFAVSEACVRHLYDEWQLLLTNN